MRLILCTLGASATLALSACATFSQQDRYAGPVKAIEADDAVHCKYIGALSSSSGLTGLFAPKGVDNIQNNLLHQADAMGATHVVWDKSFAGYDSTTQSGRAYICPKAAK